MSSNPLIRRLSLPAGQRSHSPSPSVLSASSLPPLDRVYTLPDILEVPEGIDAADLVKLSGQYLPFNFGAEFELILRPKRIASLPSIALRWCELPAAHATEREKRDFGVMLLSDIAFLLTDAGFPAEAYDLNSESKPDYSKWNVMMDASLSKHHRVKGFFPVEIVTPKIRADASWPRTVEKFWLLLAHHFDFRQEMSCGFHAHVFLVSGSYTLDQLRRMAKAVVFWGSCTARCAPPSRQDFVQDFCKSNVVHSDVPVNRDFTKHGPLRFLKHAFTKIDKADRDEVIRLVCLDKYRAWNFLPAREGGPGSIEHRRLPGVTDVVRSKHWIAFTLSFVEMALAFDPDSLAARYHRSANLMKLPFPRFASTLIECAKRIEVHHFLDITLKQTDNPRRLHITSLDKRKLAWLKKNFDRGYHYSVFGR